MYVSGAEDMHRQMFQINFLIRFVGLATQVMPSSFWVPETFAHHQAGSSFWMATRTSCIFPSVVTSHRPAVLN